MLEQREGQQERLSDAYTMDVFWGAEAGDERLLEGIYDFWMRQEKESVNMRFGCTRVPVTREYQKILHNAAVVVALFDDERKVVGYAEACYSTGGKSRVEFAVAVDESHKRQGLASMMMGSLLEGCIHLGVKEIEAQVLPYNQPILSLVKKLKESLPVTTKYAGDYIDVKIDLELVRNQGVK